jgi:hypothetical protein
VEWEYLPYCSCIRTTYLIATNKNTSFWYRERQRQREKGEKELGGERDKERERVRKSNIPEITKD